jgi:hypothetical protein
MLLSVTAKQKIFFTLALGGIGLGMFGCIVTKAPPTPAGVPGCVPSAASSETSMLPLRVGSGQADTVASAQPPVPQSANLNCAWPCEADQARIKYARVRVRVSVSAEGQATAVEILNDPGYGFSRSTRTCLTRMKFRSALDSNGQAVAAVTPPFAITYAR